MKLTNYTEQKGYYEINHMRVTYPTKITPYRDVLREAGSVYFMNRSYQGKRNTAANESDLDLIINTKKAMGRKSVIVSISMENPPVMAETIEEHKEDLAFDYEAYLDEDGNMYAYGFGMNF